MKCGVSSCISNFNKITIPITSVLYFYENTFSKSNNFRSISFKHLKCVYKNDKQIVHFRFSGYETAHVDIIQYHVCINSVVNCITTRVESLNGQPYLLTLK